MIVLSGIPRGGTSVGMQIMAAALGADRILGEANPLEKRQEAQAKQREKFRARLNDCQRYANDRQENSGDKEGRDKAARARKLNPKGFYEMAFCVAGIRYIPKWAEELGRDFEAQLGGAFAEKVVKVVAQGLATSDPAHVSKVVYMVRNPRAVAVSQEKLLRGDMFDESTAPKVDGKKSLVRSVAMFNRATVAAARWIVKNEKPALLVHYDDLIDAPARPLSALQEFIGEGDFLVEGAGAIRKDLRRSEPATDTGPAWDFADDIFERLQVGDFAGIVALADALAEEMKTAPFIPKKWHCFRVDGQVNETICGLCHDGGQTPTALNFIHNATKRGIDWENEPCLFECGINSETDQLSIEDSIAGNHWLALIGSTPAKK